MSNLLPLLSVTFIVISAVLVAFGLYHIKQGHRETHQKFMVAGAVFALVFFIMYLSRTVFVGNTGFSESAPEGTRIAYFIFLMFHIVLATVSAVFGIITLLQAYKQNFVKHKTVGRWTAVLWLLTAPTGVVVYILLYVLYPGGTTKPMIDAIFGW